MHERYIFRVYINFAHHIEEYMAGFYIFATFGSFALLLCILKCFTFSSTLSSRVSSGGAFSHLISLSPIRKYASKHKILRMWMCVVEPNGWMGWKTFYSHVRIYTHVHTYFSRVYMLTVRICTEYKFSNPYDSTLLLLLLFLLLILFHFILCCTFFCPPSRSQFYIHSIRSSVLLYVC